VTIRDSIAILLALLLAGCASTPTPTGPISVVIKHPFNTVTGGLIEADVEVNGSFVNGWREGNSSVAVYGLLKPAKRGAYEVTFSYQCTIARAPNVVDSRSLQATVMTQVNDVQPVGDIMARKDGSRHPGAADGISFELRQQVPENVPGP
jgi:hypothetical protein